MEQDIVTELRVKIPLAVAAVGGAAALHVAAEEVDDTVLNLLCDICKIHVVPATSRAFDLQIIAVVLVESLQTLDQEEVDSKP